MFASERGTFLRKNVFIQNGTYEGSVYYVPKYVNGLHSRNVNISFEWDFFISQKFE